MTDMILLSYVCAGVISGTGGFPILGRPSYMSGVVCDGSETSLFVCSHSTESSAECNDNSIAGVICQGISIIYPSSVTSSFACS